MVTGLSHITLRVKSLDKATEFFMAIFDAQLVYDSGEDTFSLARERFLLVGGLWLCIMQAEADAGPPRDYEHIAFQIEEREFERYRQRVEQHAAAVRPGRPRVPGEGRSLYFYDADGHLFELHTGSLQARLKQYVKG